MPFLDTFLQFLSSKAHALAAQALEAEQQQEEKKGFIATLLAASSSESEDETPVSESSKPKVAVVTATGTVLLLLCTFAPFQSAFIRVSPCINGNGVVMSAGLAYSRHTPRKQVFC